MKKEIALEFRGILKGLKWKRLNPQIIEILLFNKVYDDTVFDPSFIENKWKSKRLPDELIINGKYYHLNSELLEEIYNVFEYVIELVRIDDDPEWAKIISYINSNLDLHDRKIALKKAYREYYPQNNKMFELYRHSIKKSTNNETDLEEWKYFMIKKIMTNDELLIIYLTTPALDNYNEISIGDRLPLYKIEEGELLKNILFKSYSKNAFVKELVRWTMFRMISNNLDWIEAESYKLEHGTREIRTIENKDGDFNGDETFLKTIFKNKTQYTPILNQLIEHKIIKPDGNQYIPIIPERYQGKNKGEVNFISSIGIQLDIKGYLIKHEEGELAKGLNSIFNTTLIKQNINAFRGSKKMFDYLAHTSFIPNIKKKL